MREDLLPTTLPGKIAKLTEECGEVLQAIGKLQRFSANAIDPVTKIRYDNIGQLHEELIHLLNAIDEVLVSLP